MFDGGANIRVERDQWLVKRVNCVFFDYAAIVAGLHNASRLSAGVESIAVSSISSLHTATTTRLEACVNEASSQT